MKTTITKEEVSKVLKIFNINQLSEINYGLESGVDISVYMDPKYDSDQMREIRKGLEQGLDVSIYADSRYNGDQMQRIRWGLERDIDVSSYVNPDISAEEMSVVLRQLLTEREQETESIDR